MKDRKIEKKEETCKEEFIVKMKHVYSLQMTKNLEEKNSGKGGTPALLGDERTDWGAYLNLGVIWIGEVSWDELSYINYQKNQKNQKCYLNCL